MLTHVRQWLPGPRSCRMRTGPRGRYYRCLVVVSVDLDDSTVTAHPRPTPLTQDPEGVHAVVWSGGVPVGELTVPGDPDELLSTLPHIASREFTGVPAA